MKTIHTQELFNRIKTGPVAVFDLRGDVEYELGHIPGSKTAPRGSLSFRVASNMNSDSFIVVYSSGVGDDGSIDAIERLEGLKMTNVHRYVEGIEGWQRDGHEIVESPDAKVQARGPVVDVRPVVVDRERAYGGAFKHAPADTSAAGG